MPPQIFSCKVPIAQEYDEMQKDFDRQERESISTIGETDMGKLANVWAKSTRKTLDAFQ